MSETRSSVCWLTADTPHDEKLVRCIYKRPFRPGLRQLLGGLEGTTAEYWGTQFWLPISHEFIVIWLVVSNMTGLFSISYMGCHPFHWLIFINMVKTTNQLFFSWTISKTMGFNTIVWSHDLDDLGSIFLRTPPISTKSPFGWLPSGNLT